MKNDRIQRWFGVTSHWSSVVFLFHLPPKIRSCANIALPDLLMLFVSQYSLCSSVILSE